MSMYNILFYTLTQKKGNAWVEGKTRSAVDWGNSNFRIQWHCSLDTTSAASSIKDRALRIR